MSGVIALLARVSNAITTGGQRAVRVAAVIIDGVAIIALLDDLLNDPVTADSELAFVGAAIGVDRVTIVAGLVRGVQGAIAANFYHYRVSTREEEC